jgi:hypothetical protein
MILTSCSGSSAAMSVALQVDVHRTQGATPTAPRIGLRSRNARKRRGLPSDRTAGLGGAGDRQSAFSRVLLTRSRGTCRGGCRPARPRVRGPRSPHALRLGPMGADLLDRIRSRDQIETRGSSRSRRHCRSGYTVAPLGSRIAAFSALRKSVASRLETTSTCRS